VNLNPAGIRCRVVDDHDPNRPLTLREVVDDVAWSRMCVAELLANSSNFEDPVKLESLFHAARNADAVEKEFNRVLEQWPTNGQVN
jgi:hypothetical protein